MERTRECRRSALGVGRAYIRSGSDCVALGGREPLRELDQIGSLSSATPDTKFGAQHEARRETSAPHLRLPQRRAPSLHVYMTLGYVGLKVRMNGSVADEIAFRP